MISQCDQRDWDTQSCGSLEKQGGPLQRMLEGFPEEEDCELRPKVCTDVSQGKGILGRDYSLAGD